MPLDPPLLDLFQNTTSSSDAPEIRVVLVQTNPSGKSLSLINSLPPSGSDKEDFEPLLGQLFQSEPTRSGYALYRLDTQAANGEWEWLCIAYQPDGAKVKEKMQYTMTRTSLISGLNERHFLDTMYATSSGDFKFPAKLRNARKHDYQNPQLKTAGKSAADAAGTDAGGAKRNFGARSAAAAAGATEAATSPMAKAQAASDVAQQTAHDEEESIPPATDSAPPPAPETLLAAAAPSTPPEQRAPPLDDDTILKDIQSAPQSGAPLDALAQSAAAGATTDGEETDSIAPSAQPHLPPGDPADANAARLDADKELGASSGAVENDSIQQQAQDEKKAPEQPPTRADKDVPTDQLSQPLVPSPETARTQLGEDVPVAKPRSEQEHKAPEEPPTRADDRLSKAELSQPQVPSAETARAQVGQDVPIAKPPAINTGVSSSSASAAADGQAAASISKTTQAAPSASKTTQAAPSASAAPPPNQARSSSSSSSAGGKSSSGDSSYSSPKTVTWTSEAEAALTGLAMRLSGSSEHNFVSTTLTASSNNEVQMDVTSPPRFVPPGDLTSVLESEVKGVAGVRFAFYRYPTEVNSKKSAFMYTEAPTGGSTTDKNLWANHLSAVQTKASELIGCDVQREQVGAQYGPYPRPTPAQAEEVASRIQSIRYRIEEATKQSGRDKPPRLVAVSKLHPPSSIMAAYVHTGQVHFGENYVQEMVDKAKVLPSDLKWHFVGGLQSNKGKALAAIPNLYLVETLDSIKAANVLEKALAAPDAAQRDEPLRVYLQVNTSGEEAKSGVAPLSSRETEAGAESTPPPLLELATHVITSCPHIQLQGLMTIGSATNSKDSKSSQPTSDIQAALDANPDFARIHTSRAQLVRRLREKRVQPANADAETRYKALLQGDDDDAEGGLELSIGMTNDFPIAISAGSGNVRIGTACFGERPGSREEARKGMEAELLSSGDSSSSKSAQQQQAGAGAGGKGFAKPRRPGK